MDNTILTYWMLCVCVRGVAADIYTSSAQVQRLLDSERGFLVFLEQLFNSYSKQNPVFESVLENVQRDLKAVPVTSSAGHPLESVIGLLRYYEYVEKYLKFLSLDVKRKVEESLEKVGLSLPNKFTLAGSQHGLFRVQSTYKLSARSLITSSNVNITSQQCVTLATHARKAGLSKLASQWVYEAEHLTPYKNSKGKPNSWTEGKHCKEGGVPCKNIAGEDDEFQYLCSKYIDKKTLGSTSASSVCYYQTGGFPLIRWRTEELYKDPPIVLYHDVMSDREAELFVRLGTVLLERATTGKSPGNSTLHESRTSKVAWLWDNHTDTIDMVSRRVTDITGLETRFRDHATFAEPFQVVNYGIGGHYAPHYDYYVNQKNLKNLKGFSKNSGDRMATFMFYLSQVDLGGATVFPELGIGAPPIKNAALYWHNFRSDGTPDPRTLHGGCPVLYGHKWVANKWIRQISAAMTMNCAAPPE